MAGLMMEEDEPSRADRTREGDRVCNTRAAPARSAPRTHPQRTTRRAEARRRPRRARRLRSSRSAVQRSPLRAPVRDPADTRSSISRFRSENRPSAQGGQRAPPPAMRPRPSTAGAERRGTSPAPGCRGDRPGTAAGEGTRDPLPQTRERRRRSPDVERHALVPERREEPQSLEMVEVQVGEEEMDSIRSAVQELEAEGPDPGAGVEHEHAPVIE